MTAPTIRASMCCFCGPSSVEECHFGVAEEEVLVALLKTWIAKENKHCHRSECAATITVEINHDVHHPPTNNEPAVPLVVNGREI